jgi:predicted peroxiredoxin
MKKATFFLFLLVLSVFLACNAQDNPAPAGMEMANKDGIFIHISHGPEDAHRVLMALNMAALMADSRDVLIYFDITGVEVVVKEAPDIAFSHFPTSHAQLKTLLEKNVTIMACPGCLKAAGKTPEDLMEGIQVADKDKFFSFTSGRILTIDY